MAIKLDQTFISQHFANEVTAIAQDAGDSPSVILTQEVILQNRITVCQQIETLSNEIIKKIKEALQDDVNLCQVTLMLVPDANSKENLFQREDLIRKIYWDTLKIKIGKSAWYEHFKQPNMVFPQKSHRQSYGSNLKVMWKYHQGKVIKSLLGMPTNPSESLEESQILNGFRKQAAHKYCDFTFIVKEKEFPIHKVILAKSSAYFDRMFSQAIHNEPGKIGLEAVTVEIFEEFLNYIYTGVMDFSNKSVNYYIDLAALGNLTGIHSLMDMCYDQLQQSINTGNFYPIAKHAATVGKEKLTACCKNFLVQNPHFPDTLNISVMTLQELVECYNIAHLLESERLKSRVLIQISSKMNKDTFQTFCETASNTQLNSLKDELKKICLNFVTSNKELMQSEAMQNARSIYTKLMTGL